MKKKQQRIMHLTSVENNADVSLKVDGAYSWQLIQKRNIVP